MLRTFDAKQYAKQYYSTIQGDKRQNLGTAYYSWYDQLINMLPQCDLCLQIGTGPVLVLSTYASRKCKKIILSDYNLGSFQLIKQWINNEDSQYMHGHFELIAKQEGKTVEQIKDRQRKAIILATQCDLTKKQIVNFAYTKKMDFIISSLTLQCVAQNYDQYIEMIHNISKLLKSKGFLLIFTVLEDHYYVVGDQKLPFLHLKDSQIISALIKNNFEIVSTKIQKLQNILSEVSNFKGMFCCLAQLK